ncbi:MAG TPA: FAD-dependent oxidoreductase, partial [Phototrophicaceae bacterium]|nr:FAD-dependent oxidoreductase [Phototrophicaceae bacterium]
TIIEHTTVTAIQSNEIVIRGGDNLPFDICIWAGGFKALPLAQQSGLIVNERRQILVDPWLRSISHPNIYAVGDSAAPVHPVGAPFRMSVFVAMVTGAHAADNLTCMLHGKAQQTFGFSFYGQAIALGRHNAIGFLTFPDDKPIGPLYTGRAGYYMRAFFVWFLHFSLTLEKHFPGSYSWGGKRRGTTLEIEGASAAVAGMSAASNSVYIIPKTGSESVPEGI